LADRNHSVAAARQAGQVAHLAPGAAAFQAADHGRFDRYLASAFADSAGALVAEGPPEKVARVKASYTGQFLKRILKQ
jgi:hypothetical protein